MTSFAPAVHVPEQPTPVTLDAVAIDPTSNDFALPECSTRQETITVTVPKSEVAPKAGVYLLADTTDSMGPIIGAVQAGIIAVVNDPAFAAFDIAWGAGNYQDFPFQPSSFAFQHQLALAPGSAAVAAAV